jgi:hypothetical protein
MVPHSRLIYYSLEHYTTTEELLHYGENSRIFLHESDKKFPVTNYFEIDNWKIFFSYLSRNG